MTAGAVSDNPGGAARHGARREEGGVRDGLAPGNADGVPRERFITRPPRAPGLLTSVFLFCGLGQ